MISYDLLLAFVLALVAWALIHVARAIRGLAAAMGEQTDVLTQLARHLDEATVTIAESNTAP